MTNDVLEREPIGLKDKNGNDIHLGDLVEFFGCPTHGPSAVETPCAARVVDFVSRIDEKTPIPGHFTRTYYFVNFVGHPAYARDFAKYCRVVGTFPKDAALFIDQMPRSLITMLGRERLISVAKETPLAVQQ